MEPQSLAAAIEAGKNLTQLHQAEGYKPALTAPHLSGPVKLEPEKLDAPRFITAAPTFIDFAAFIRYVNDFKDEDTRIFYTPNGSFLAVFDYHQFAHDEDDFVAGRHGDHTAKLALAASPEWQAWAGMNEKAMGQQSMAEFVEDNLPDIIEPDAAVMLAAASGLHATTGGTFRQATNLANGEASFQFDEQVMGSIKSTGASIPTEFKIALRPWLGCDRYPVDCRFRYRVRDGALALHYKALRLHVVLETALEGIVQKITEATDIIPDLGAHDAAAFLRGQ
ncbi:MAG: YfdQ family protein [Planctomycetes bacterium]|nr:YfdQ family protein [Planctomycetota bacterium]